MKGQLYATLMPRRLTAEELRDAILWSSGELNLQVGGIPARPDINTEVMGGVYYHTLSMIWIVSH